MFVENEELDLFAKEFKRCYVELINGLSKIWEEYDYKTGSGDAFASLDYSKEEIEKINNDLVSSIHQLVLDISSSFKYTEQKSLVSSIFAYLANDYAKIHWQNNILDFDDDGKIQQPIDLYSYLSEYHQGRLNFIVESIDNIGRKDVKKYVIEKYKKLLNQQAETIINKYKETLELMWNRVIFINCKKGNYFFVDMEL